MHTCIHASRVGVAAAATDRQTDRQTDGVAAESGTGWGGLGGGAKKRDGAAARHEDGGEAWLGGKGGHAGGKKVTRQLGFQSGPPRSY